MKRSVPRCAATIALLLLTSCSTVRYVHFPPVDIAAETLNCEPAIASATGQPLRCIPRDTLRSAPPLWREAEAVGAHSHPPVELPGYVAGQASLWTGVVSPDGRRIVIVEYPRDSFLGRIFDLRSGDRGPTLPDASVGTERGLVFSPDGDKIATAGQDGIARIFSARDGRLLWMAETPPCGGEMFGGDHTLQSVSFDRTGKLLLTANSGGTVSLWDVERSELKWARCHSDWNGGRIWVQQAAFFPGDRGLLVLRYDGLQVWTLAGEPAGAFRLPLATVALEHATGPANAGGTLVDFDTSDDGRILVIHGRTGVRSAQEPNRQLDGSDWLMIWSLKEAEARYEFRYVPEPLGLTRVSRDGRWVAALGASGYHVWATCSGGRRYHIPPSRIGSEGYGSNFWMDFSPDGRTLYTINYHAHPVIAWELPAATASGDCE